MLVKRGHRVVLLTLCEPGLLHPIAENLGAEIESIDLRGKSKFYRYWFGVKRLYQAIKKYDIELVIAQQQMPALMSGVLHLFHKFKLVYVRHNTDEDYQNGYYKANALNRLVNKLVPNKIAPSRIVEKFWIEREGVRPQTIRRISYGYNFSQYQQADPAVVAQIREQHNCHLLILSIARMVPAKRHILMFQSVQEAIARGVDCRMICLGTGPDEAIIKSWVKSQNLQDKIDVIGFRSNILDYLHAADLYLHLSNTEASNSSVKEAGIASCPVIVCRQVGDFEDYIQDGVNGFLMPKVTNPGEVASKIMEASSNKAKLKEMGQNLRSTVLSTFDINNVAKDYDKLINDVTR